MLTTADSKPRQFSGIPETCVHVRLERGNQNCLFDSNRRVSRPPIVALHIALMINGSVPTELANTPHAPSPSLASFTDFYSEFHMLHFITFIIFITRLMAHTIYFVK